MLTQKKIANGPLNGKCNLTLIPIKKQVIFSRKSDSANVSDLPIKFNNNSIAKCPSQKHLVIVLDSKLNFNSHVHEQILKCIKLIEFVRRISVNLPQIASLTIYKSFIRPHLGDSAKSRGFRGNVGCVGYVGQFFLCGSKCFCVGLCLDQHFLGGSKIFALVNFYLLDEIILLYYY